MFHLEAIAPYHQRDRIFGKEMTNFASQPQQSNEDDLTAPSTDGISAEVVPSDILRESSFADSAESCFLRTLASYITDRVLLPGAASIATPLADTTREEVANQLGEFFIQHTREYLARCEENGAKANEVPTNDQIKEMARFVTVKFGNTMEEGKPIGAFAVEYQRALESKNQCHFIISKQEGDPSVILGLMTVEHYATETGKEGVYLRELMIDPRFRSGSVVSTIFDKCVSMAHHAEEVSIATRANNADGEPSKTIKLYRVFGFKEESANEDQVLSQHAAILSQNLDSSVYTYMKSDIPSLQKGMTRFQRFF